MKRWTKILIGAQTLALVVALAYCYILSDEAMKQEAVALQQAELARQAQQMAEEQAEAASRSEAESHVAFAKAEEARQKLAEALAACQGKKK